MKTGEPDSTCKRIIVFGPECSGKTTLTQQLANYFGTSWSPEYARPYLTYKNDIENRWQRGFISVYEDVEPMSIGQMAVEDHALACAANGIVFHDTNLLTNLIYAKYYFGQAPEWLPLMVNNRAYDGYLLLEPNLPWRADGLRDRPSQRNLLLEIFKNALHVHQCRYAQISATGEERFQQALVALSEWGISAPTKP
jgi:NadR type nicotinamide-nucleotide adenylyltransferase